jgi:hypothetical protein
MRCFAAFCGVQTPFSAKWDGAAAAGPAMQLSSVYPYLSYFKPIIPVFLKYFRPVVPVGGERGEVYEGDHPHMA